MRRVQSIVVASLPNKVSEVIEACRVVLIRMSGNPYFSSPNPTLEVFREHIYALEATDANVKNSPDGVSIRDAALYVINRDVRHLVNYVQLIADADPDNAEVIINSSGLHIKKTRSGSREKGYDVQSKTTGIVILSAPANNYRYPYIWEVSKNAIDWSFLMVSRNCTAKCETLISGKIYYFRYTVVGENDKPSAPSAAMGCVVR